MSSKWKTGKYVFEMLTPKPKVKIKGQKSVKDIQLKTSSKKFQMAVEDFAEKTKEAYKTKK